MRVLAIAFLFILSQMVSWARPDTDSLRVSLLTCTPGKEIFELYGHTAIRITCIPQTAGPTAQTDNEDWVFNFGVFSFNQPHFVARFVKGDTDYTMDAVPFNAFLAAYLNEGRNVVEQKLSLTQPEARRLYQALLRLIRSEGWTYRYNFFKDNCTTRARDMIEQAIDGKVLYPQSDSVLTYRSIIHAYTSQSPWSEVGQDLLLGAEADIPLTVREQQFVPFRLKEAFANASVEATPLTPRRRLVAAEGTYTAPRPLVAQATVVGPKMASNVLCCLTLALLVIRWRRRDAGWLWGYDGMLLLLQGAIGVVISYLFCFSTHPTVGSNWLIAVFNPLPLIALPFVLRRSRKRRSVAYHYVAGTVLLAFCLGKPLIPQHIPTPVLSLAWNLLLLSAGYILIHLYSMKSTSHP